VPAITDRGTCRRSARIVERARLLLLRRPRNHDFYAADLDDDTVRTLLNELASEIGCTLEQEEVYVGYRDRTWTLKRSQ
jgi:hypothetical protein